jgi:LysM repeat protein
MAARRYVPFILLNILVSAAVVMGILYLWDQRQTEEPSVAATTPFSDTTPATTAEAAAAAELEPASTELPSSLVVHIVQAGETLGIIAQQFDVPWQDIATYNNLSDPNQIKPGQELVIPVGGIPTLTPEPTATPTLAQPPTPIPTVPPAAGEARVIIRDIRGVGELDAEVVIIANEGSRQIDLVNWRLEDGHGNVYIFKPLILFGDGVTLMLYTKKGVDTTSALNWGIEFPVWESGETATLRDADGTARHSYTIP